MIAVRLPQCGLEVPAGFDAEADRRRVDRETADQVTRDVRARILARLPAGLTTQTVTELLARVREPRFRAVAERWTWDAPSVALSGPSGTGKTTACAIAYRRLLDASDGRWRALRWVSVLRLVSARRDRGDHAPDDVDPTVLLERASLLVLDDLGQEPPIDVAREVLQGLVDARYLAGLPTLTTTELTQQQLLDRYGVALVRRLYEARGGGAPGLVIEAGRRAA